MKETTSTGAIAPEMPVSNGAKQSNQNKTAATITPGLAFAVKELDEALDDYGAEGLITQLLKQESDYALLLSDIQCGVGNIERPETEDAAVVLEDIRRVATLNATEYNDRMFLLRTLADMITAADSVCFQFKFEKQ